MSSKNFASIRSIIGCLALMASISASIESSFAQAPVTTSTTTTTVNTAPSKVKSSATHLRKRRAKTAKRRTATRTTVTTRSGLAGGVSHSHRHRVVKSTRLKAHEKIDSKQQARSNKLNAFLKHPPAMKKTPYFNHPGLDTPSSPAL